MKKFEQLKLSRELNGLVSGIQSGEISGVAKIKASRRINEIVGMLGGGDNAADPGDLTAAGAEQFHTNLKAALDVDLSPFERIVRDNEITIDTLQGAVNSTQMLLNSVEIPKIFIDAVNVVSNKVSDGSLLDSLGQDGIVLLNQLDVLVEQKSEGMLDATYDGEATQRTANYLKELFVIGGWTENADKLWSNANESFQFRINESRLYTFDIEAYQGNVHIQTITCNGSFIGECLDFINIYVQNIDNRLTYKEDGGDLPPDIDELTAAVTQDNVIQVTDAIAQSASTSRDNKGENPTQEQLIANDYKTAKVVISGMNISIENPIGSVRSGVDQDGTAWETTMSAHYGYFDDTVGADGDELDVFIAPNVPHDYEGPIFVISQVDQRGNFDEHKVVIGVHSKVIAVELYRAHYDENFNGAGSVREYTLEDFKARIYGEKTALLDSVTNQMLDSWIDDGKFELLPLRKLDLGRLDDGKTEAKATIKDPIVVYVQGAKNYVIHGRKRLAIAQNNGEAFIPSIVIEADQGYTIDDLKNARRKCGSTVYAESLGAMIEVCAQKRLTKDLA